MQLDLKLSSHSTSTAIVCEARTRENSGFFIEGDSKA